LAADGQNAAVDLSPYLGKLGLRANAFATLFELLKTRFEQKGPLTLVETGCVRQLENWEGDGNSTILFHKFAEQTGSRLYTIDIDADHCRLAIENCPGAIVVCGDSVAELYRLRKSLSAIDFLYLDSFDLDWNNPHPSALHHLKELCAAAPLLRPGAIVFVDDNASGAGKGMYVAEYMRAIGATIVSDGYCLGFVWP